MNSKFSIFLLVLVSTSLSACFGCRKKKNIEPVVVAASKPNPLQRAHNTLLLEGAKCGSPEIVRTAIELKADVNAVNVDHRRAMYTAASLAVYHYDPDNAHASNRFVEIMNILTRAKAHQAEDIADFIDKEPIKSSFLADLETQGHTKEVALNVLAYNVQEVAEFNARKRQQKEGYPEQSNEQQSLSK